MTNEKKILTNIQALRAFAALNVVLYHTLVAAPSYGYPVSFLKFIEDWGHNGVDVFFVISGFIMVYIQHQRPKSVGMFLKDRVIRIVPVYWLLTLFFGLILLASPTIFREVRYSTEWILASMVFVSAWTLGKTPLVYVGWTLEIEMLFYVLFACSLVLKKTFHAVMMCAALIATAVWLGSSNILFEFIFGMFIGCFYLRKNLDRWFAWIIFIFGVVSLLATIGMNTSDYPRVLVFGVPSIFIVLGCLYIPQTRNKLTTALGNASYSTYLIQVFSIPAFYKLANAVGLSGLNNDVLAIVCVAATAIAGQALYEYFEIPTARFLGKRRQRQA